MGKLKSPRLRARLRRAKQNPKPKNVGLMVFLLPTLVTTLALGGCAKRALPPPPPGGTYLSQSAGASFEQYVTVEGSEGEYIASLPLRAAHRPALKPQSVYLAAGEAGLVVSHRGGETWQTVAVPLRMTSDVVLLGNGTLVVAGTGSEGQGYILRSLDDGVSWQTVLTIPVPVANRGWQIIKDQSTAATIILSLEPDPFDADRLYAGSNLGTVFAGEQSAKVWRTITALGPGSLATALNQQSAIGRLFPSPHNPGELYVVTLDRTLWRLAGSSQERVTIPKNLTGRASAVSDVGNRRVHHVGFIPSAPQALFVGVEDGAVVSRDGGKTWQELALPVDTSTRFNSVVTQASPTNPSRLLVAINSVVYRSEDGGQTWNTFDFGLPDWMIIDLLIDPTNAARVLAITANIPS